MEQLTENWVAGAWTASSRRTITNNGNHQQVLVLQEQWQNEWINQYRETYTYGSSDELLTFQLEAWESDWMTTEQTTYTYDGQLRLTEEFGQLFEGGIVIFETKDIYTYDSQGNPASITNQTNEGGALSDRWRELLAYDDENNQINYVYQYWDGSWVSNDSAYFYWNPVTSVSDVSTLTDGMVVFPNPASHEIHCKLATGEETDAYEILNMDGKVIQRGRIFSNLVIDIAGLSDGMYVLRLFDKQVAMRLQRFIKM